MVTTRPGRASNARSTARFEKRQTKRRVTVQQALAWDVEHGVAMGDDSEGRGIGAAQNRRDARDECPVAPGARQIVVDARVERAHDVVLGIASAEHDDRQPRARADRRAQTARVELRAVGDHDQVDLGSERP